MPVPFGSYFCHNCNQYTMVYFTEGDIRCSKCHHRIGGKDFR